MSKFKPHKGLTKRVRISATGKVKHKRSFAGHLMSHKSGLRCQRLRKAGFAKGAFRQKILVHLGLA